MAIKNRVLKNLELVRNSVEQNQFDSALNNLLVAKDLCQKGLTAENYTSYDEIYNGLILALNELTKNGYIEELTNLSVELLNYLKNQTQNEENFKKEIVFLCYQASMWDSLESVWKAAYEDKDHCIAYVIPVPYTNKNKDFSINEWHLDINEFPDYVPVTHFKDINLENLHPDVIFFNNPYDEFNNVTMLDSRFFSGKLLQYTDKLIYIPYFILDDNVGEETIANYAYLPGVMNADLVIVQSESIREKYINALLKTPWKDRTYWEKRILGIGSPKIDKVLTSKKEDFSLPKDWENLIKNKKVVLYNTSLSIMYKDAENAIKKMRLIFDYFKNRTDIVLWWRPHPLMKYTIHSLDEKLEKEYLKLEKEYIKNKIGIYDDTSDLHRAICYSDMYYGDIASSIVNLYRYTAKPILVQEVVIDVEADFRIRFLNFCFEDNKLFGVSAIANSDLYQINLNTNESEYLGRLPVKQRSLGYSIIEKINDKLIIPPFCSREGLVIYNTKTKQFKSILLKPECFPKNSLEAFGYGFRYNNSVFFIGCFTGIILEYNDASEDVIYHYEWSNELRKEIKLEDLRFDSLGYVHKGNYLYMTVYMTNIIIKLDMNTLTSDIHKIPYDYKALNLCYDGEFFWITPEEQDFILRWDEKLDIYTKINLHKKVSSMLAAVSIADNILLFPFFTSDYILKINKYTFRVTNDKMLEKMIDKLSFYKYYAFNDKSNIIFAELSNRTIQEINTKNGEIKIHKIKYDLWNRQNIYQIDDTQKGVGKKIYKLSLNKKY